MKHESPDESAAVHGGGGNLSREEHAQEGSRFGFLLWLCLLPIIYLLSTGPVTRFFPNAADKIYAPLGPLAGSEVCGPIVRKWLSLWGVN